MTVAVAGSSATSSAGDDCYVMTAYVRDVEHLEEIIDRFADCGQTTTAIMQSSPVARRPVAPLD